MTLYDENEVEKNQTAREKSLPTLFVVHAGWDEKLHSLLRQGTKMVANPVNIDYHRLARSEYR